MNHRIPVIDLHYFPCLEYFVLLSCYPHVTLDLYENYQKQSYRNRCYLLGADKVQSLIVPVENGNRKVIVKDIKIDYSQKWLNVHWRTIASAYGKSPFFLFYGDYFRNILFKKHKYLFELNIELLIQLVQLLEIKTKIEFTSSYMKEVDESQIDLRSAIHPKKDYNDNGVYKPSPYNQIFGKEFVNNLSILDLLFCEGRNAMNVLKNSTKIEVFKAQK